MFNSVSGFSLRSAHFLKLTIMLKRVSVLIVLGVILSFSGCVHEETEDCVQGIRLRFTYTLNNQQVNLFGANVEMVTVFAFDESGKYLNTYSSKGTTLTKDYVMTLPLKAGKYSFVVLGGNLSSYQIVEMINSATDEISSELKQGQTDIQKLAFLIDANPPASGPLVIDNMLTDLYHGVIMGFESPLGVVSEATVDLIKDTNNINIMILGMDYLYKYIEDMGGDIKNVLAFDVFSDNGRYMYDNSPDLYSHELNYKFFNTRVNGDTLCTTTRILRLFATNDPTVLSVKIPDKTDIYSTNLVSAIMQNPDYNSQTDLDREDQYNFVIRFQPDYTVEITINDWEIVSIVPSN